MTYNRFDTGSAEIDNQFNFIDDEVYRKCWIKIRKFWNPCQQLISDCPEQFFKRLDSRIDCFKFLRSFGKRCLVIHLYLMLEIALLVLFVEHNHGSAIAIWWLSIKHSEVLLRKICHNQHSVSRRVNKISAFLACGELERSCGLWVCTPFFFVFDESSPIVMSISEVSCK